MVGNALGQLKLKLHSLLLVGVKTLRQYKIKGWCGTDIQNLVPLLFPNIHKKKKNKKQKKEEKKAVYLSY